MRTRRPQRSASLQVVRDENQCRLPAPLQAEQQIDHLLAGLAVEVAGRLVGQDDLRARAERAGDGHALLLAARELRREMIGAMRRGRPRPAGARATSKASALPANSSGSATFSSAVMVGTRWNDWKTMPMLLPRTSASSSSLRPMKSWPATRTEPDVARSRPAMIISSEVLPEPLGPTTATDSPGAMPTSTPLRISTGPARLASVSETPRKAMTGSATIRKRLLPEGLPGLCKFLRQYTRDVRH